MANFNIFSQEKENDDETTMLSQKIVHDSYEVHPKQRRIFLVTEGHRSKKTEEKYGNGFQHFLDYIRISDLDVLLDLWTLSTLAQMKVYNTIWIDVTNYRTS